VCERDARQQGQPGGTAGEREQHPQAEPLGQRRGGDEALEARAHPSTLPPCASLELRDRRRRVVAVARSHGVGGARVQRRQPLAL